jgi:nucleoredoxin
MAALASLLGAKLQSKSGEVDTVAALDGKKAIALYFSAHWCPPCRGFTPKLSEWYTKDLKSKGLEVVFVSSDKDDAAFNSYFGEQPWLALPFSDREKKADLSKKFKVQGIPSLVIVGPDGQTITTDGRSAISEDPTGEEMPWKPKTFKEVFDTAKIVGKDGTSMLGKDIQAKALGIYFSAHWCPPCRGFTPKLAEWYKSDLKSKGLEVVFVSSDKDDSAFKDYFGEQPWLALDFEDKASKKALDSIFGVSGIPSLVIVEKDGTVINKDGRSAVSGDPTGAEFPWHPKPVSNVKDGPGEINETPSVVVFCENSDASAQKTIEETMATLAKKYMEEGKKKGEDPEVIFYIATSKTDFGGQLRKVLSMPDEPSAKPKIMLVDIPDNGAYYDGPEGDITPDVLTKLLQDWSSKTLTRKQLG